MRVCLITVTIFAWSDRFFVFICGGANKYGKAVWPCKTTYTPGARNPVATIFEFLADIVTKDCNDRFPFITPTHNLSRGIT